PAIFLANQLDHPNLYDLLQTAHIHLAKPEHYYGLALALGGAELSMQELATLYAVLANDGIWKPLRSCNIGKPVNSSEKLFSTEAAFLIRDILKNTPLPE